MSSLNVSLRRPDPSHPWGFRIAGGRDFGCSVSVRKVGPNSMAARHGLMPGDYILSIGGDATLRMTHQEAQQAIIRCGNELDLQVVRGAMPEISSPVSPGWSPPAQTHMTPQRVQQRPAQAPSRHMANANSTQQSPGVYRSNRGIQLRPQTAPQTYQPMATSPQTYQPMATSPPPFAPLHVNTGPSAGSPMPWQQQPQPYASSSSLDSPRSSPQAPPGPPAMNRLERSLNQPGRPLPIGYNPKKPAPAPPPASGTRRGQSQRRQPGSLGPADRDPICESCHGLVRGPFIVALDRCYCPEHFRCSQCNIRMENCGFVEEGGQLFCETDYARYLAPRCAKCGLPVVERVVSALHKSWHPTCFCCHACKRQLAGSEPGPGEATFRVGDDNQPYCEADWSRLFTTKCDGCGYGIEEMDQFIEVKGKIYHGSCFCCAACKVSLDGKPFVSRDGKAFCKAHARAAAIF